MVTPQNGEFSRIIRAISKFAGSLAGTAVIIGKRIIYLTTPPGEGPSDKPKKKTSQARSQTKKKVVRRTGAKTPKTKKKAIKRKGAGSSGKSGVHKKKPAQSPAKKKKSPTPGKKTTRRKTKKTAKNEVSSHSQDGLTTETDAGTNAPIEKQKSQVQLLIAEAETANEKSSNVNGSPEEGVKKEGLTESKKSSIPIIEYNDKAKKAVVSTTSVL